MPATSPAATAIPWHQDIELNCLAEFGTHAANPLHGLLCCETDQPANPLLMLLCAPLRFRSASLVGQDCVPDHDQSFPTAIQLEQEGIRILVDEITWGDVTSEDFESTPMHNPEGSKLRK